MKNNTLSESFTRVNQAVSTYVESRVDLLKIQMLEKITRIGTYFLSSVFAIVAILFVFLMLGMAFSYWYGETKGSIIHGFLITAGFFLILAFISFLFRKRLFSNQIVRNISGVVFEEEFEKTEKETI